MKAKSKFRKTGCYLLVMFIISKLNLPLGISYLNKFYKSLKSFEGLHTS